MSEQAKVPGIPRTEHEVQFDTDSKPIGIDNRASAFISGDTNDFEGELVKTNRFIKGFGGTKTGNVMRGTANVSWDDDEGKGHTFRLPNSYYVPGCNVRLLSPQHWSRELAHQHPGKPIASSNTDHKRVKLHWHNGSKTVNIDPESNVATFYSAPGYKKFDLFCNEAEIDQDEDKNPLCYDASMVSDDEESDDEADFGHSVEPEGDDYTIHTPTSDENDLQGSKAASERKPVVEEDEVEQKQMRDEAELLQHHYRFGHTSFKKLQIMAKQGIIPKRLAKCRTPVCAACMFGKATKRPWRSKTRSNADEAFQPTKLGEVVYTDQLKSSTPGFIAQNTGWLTRKRYEYATVYIEGLSGFGFIWLQKTASAKETLEGKEAFERYLEHQGIRVQHYHADNGIFKANDWVLDCKTKGQGLSFAGVNAHHQNGRAEARIRQLQELTRTQLIHARRRWPDEVSVNLWPYALRMANEAINSTPSLKDKQGRSPSDMLHKTKIETNPKHWKHFGCPAYILDEKLQGGSGIYQKWKERARVGIYLGRSAQHSRQVALVLNIVTGHVSPQFHLKLDPAFDTIGQLYQGRRLETSLWQVKAGFKEAKTTAKQESISDPNLKQKPTVTTVSEGAKEPQVPVVRFEQEPTSVIPPAMQHQPEHDVAAQDTTENQIPSPSQDIPQTHQQSTPTAAQLRRSSRRKQPVQRLVEAMSAELNDQDIEGELFSYSAMFPHDNSDQEQHPLMAFNAKADPDTLYLHEALREPDRKEFLDAMTKEIESQVNMGVYSVIKKAEVPAGATDLTGRMATQTQA